MIDITYKQLSESEAIDIDGFEFVKVVRCKDCKWCKHFTWGRYECQKVHLIPLESRENLDWFCADGERMEQVDSKMSR